MKISYIKFKEDNRDFKLAKGIGIDVFEIKDPEQIDKQIEKLRNEKYDTIVISNELASFSNNLESKYKNDDKMKIIITPNKRIKD